MLDNKYWVQYQPSTINSDSTWNVLGYFGTNTQGNRQCFEIIAIITNRTFSEGQQVTGIHGNMPKSNAITVFRLDGSQ